jgi:hypothetical protein
MCPFTHPNKRLHQNYTSLAEGIHEHVKLYTSALNCAGKLFLESI